MIDVGLFDEEFRHLPNYCGYDQSEKMRWVKDSYDHDILVFTERAYEKALDIRCHGKILCAMPLEPMVIHGYAYQKLRDGMHAHFDYILTHNDQFAEWVGKNTKAKPMFWTPGGSWIWLRDWEIYPKSKKVSIVASMKDWTVGHRLRQAVIGQYEKEFDLICGYGRNTVEHKKDIFKDYMYSVVIENCSVNTYWTDKIIDCFACGSVPIFYGNPNIGDIFNPDGIIEFTELDEIESIFEKIGPEDYERRIPAIQDNFERAKEYAIVEDYMADNVFKQILQAAKK